MSLRSHLLIIGIFTITTFSIFPWSIREFIVRQWQNTFQKNPKTVSKVGAFPEEIFTFSERVTRIVPLEKSIVFITYGGKGEKEFFMLSYRLFPRKIYWISDLKLGPISWWYENDLSLASITNFIQDKNISWIITETDKIEEVRKIAKNLHFNEIYYLWQVQ